MVFKVAETILTSVLAIVIASTPPRRVVLERRDHALWDGQTSQSNNLEVLPATVSGQCELYTDRNAINRQKDPRSGVVRTYTTVHYLGIVTEIVLQVCFQHFPRHALGRDFERIVLRHGGYFDRGVTGTINKWGCKARKLESIRTESV